MPVCEVLHTSQGEMTHLQPCASSWPTEVSGCRRPLNSNVLCVFGTGYERRTANPSKSGRVQVCDRVQSVRSRDAGKPLGKTERDPKADGTTSQKHFEKEIDPWMHGNIIRQSCRGGLGVLTGAC